MLVTTIKEHLYKSEKRDEKSNSQIKRLHNNKDNSDDRNLQFCSQ